MKKLIEKITLIDRKFAWSFLGVLLALFSFWYFRDNPPALKLEVVSRARVYDIHADVPKLAIFFEGENIKENKQSLSIFTVRATNTGGKPITQNLYDANLPFGLQLINARAFPPELVSASQRYILENLKPTLAEGNQIRFNKIVIDSNASFTIRFLALHFENIDPFLKPLGKIAGEDTQEVPIPELSPNESRFSFWTVLVSGSPLIHILRFFSYIVFLIFVGIGIGVVTSFFDERRKKRKKADIGKRFSAYQKDRSSSHAELLADIAVELGAKGLEFFIEIDGISVSEQLRISPLNDVVQRPVLELETQEGYIDFILFINKLETAKVLTKTECIIQLEVKFKEELKDFKVFWQANEPSNEKQVRGFVSSAIKAIQAEPEVCE